MNRVANVQLSLVVLLLAITATVGCEMTQQSQNPHQRRLAHLQNERSTAINDALTEMRVLKTSVDDVRRARELWTVLNNSKANDRDKKEFRRLRLAQLDASKNSLIDSVRPGKLYSAHAKFLFIKDIDEESPVYQLVMSTAQANWKARQSANQRLADQRKLQATLETNRILSEFKNNLDELGKLDWKDQDTGCDFCGGPGVDPVHAYGPCESCSILPF